MMRYIRCSPLYSDISYLEAYDVLDTHNDVEQLCDMTVRE
jgi:hypothetical protein